MSRWRGRVPKTTHLSRSYILLCCYYAAITVCWVGRLSSGYTPATPMSSSLSSEEEYAATLPRAGATLGVIRVDSSRAWRTQFAHYEHVKHCISATTAAEAAVQSEVDTSPLYILGTGHIRDSSASSDYSEDINKSDDEFLRKKA